MVVVTLYRGVVKVMPRGFQRGFTLVELVTTIILIGILAAGGSSLFFGRDVFEQRGFYDETVSSIRYAQRLAVATCSPVRVAIAANGYSLFRAAAAGNCDNPCTVGATATALADPTNPGNNFNRNTPAGTTFTAASLGNIVFCPLGNALANTTITIGVGGPQIQVWADTGYVQRLSP